MKTSEVKIVRPQAISGFPEWLPSVKILENRLLDIIRASYEKFGFVPIETPAIERAETLTSKGGDEKEIYALSRLSAEEGESPETGFALHFDLTVPLARYVAQHYNELAFPFRRYQIQKVWRGERPQSGRFREFYQCDIDVIGDGELSLMTDAEIPSIIYQVFREVNIGKFAIRLNNRKVLQGLCQHYGISDDKIAAVLTLIDKMEKIGTGRVVSGIEDVTGMAPERISELMSVISSDCGNDELLDRLERMETNALFLEGVTELRSVYENVKRFGVPDDYLVIDLRIARGLGYYTGTVYETVLKDHPGIGSICSGGRYENLASHFTDKKLPGVGISIGLTRLLDRLLKADILTAGPATVAKVLVTTMDQDRIADYLELATALRQEGINTEIFLEPLSLKAQMKYANKKKFQYVIIAGETEFAEKNLTVKNLETGEQQTLTQEAVIALLKS
ncbi:histidine--tRNA ligase [Candidatus Falkowbacteria bacterium]|nr:histidine--tRNA ligase [Candidatus Falkowbacteria bacterium]